MFQGNVSGALNFLSRKSSGAPLKLDVIIQSKEGEEVSVRDALTALHPVGKPIEDDALLHNCLPNALPSDPIIFEAINGSLVKIIALHCRGSAGPSGVDAHAWHRMCSSFKEASANVCDAIAAVARRFVALLPRQFCEWF